MHRILSNTFCDLYELPKNKKFVETLIENGGPIEISSDDESAQIAKLVTLTNIPPKYIKNKWKTHLLATWYWSNNIEMFIVWTHQRFEHEEFFMKLSKKNTNKLKMHFIYLFNTLKVNMSFILMIESRKAISFKVYGDILRIKANYERAPVYADLPELVQECIDLIVRKKWCDFPILIEYQQDEKREFVIKKQLLKIQQIFEQEIKSQFNDDKDTIAIFRNLYNLNPLNRDKQGEVLKAFDKLKHGPNQYGNKMSTVRVIQREYAYYNEVLCGYLLDGEHEEVFTEDDRKLLDQFKGKSERNFDVLSFWNCDLVKAKCKWLAKFALNTLDFAVDDVDSERFMSNLARINSNPLIKQMSAENKAIRLWSMWEEKRILNNIY